MKFRPIGACLLICLGLLAGCNDRTIVPQLPPDDDSNRMEYGEMSGLNYSPYYIHRFNVQGHDNNGISGGGPNIQPARPGHKPSGGGGGKCCAALPKKWRPGLKITVRWIADKKLDGVTYGAWYKAETELPQYGPATYGMWAIFLPDDRVKVMIMDGNANGHNRVRARPTDDDPYVAVGSIDEERTRQDEARREKLRQMKAARAAEIAREAEQEAERQKHENRQ